MSTVLVIEDNLDLQSLMATYLRILGHRCEFAANGKIALERLRDEPPPCLILLDWLMPVMGGAEFLAAREMKQEWKEIPVVVLSGLTLLDSPPATLAVLRKPVQLGDLKDIIEIHARSQGVKELEL